MEQPIFIFATGWRTGSTLVQRLLCSHPDIMVWGENRGIVDHLMAMNSTVQQLQELSQQHRRHFQSQGCLGWIAMMNPPASTLPDASRRFLEAYFHEPAKDMGKARWGFKEVRHGSDAARFLAELYPGARFILLTRHPEDALASARAPVRGDLPHKGSILAEAGGPRRFLLHWARLAHDFVHGFQGIPNILLKHENIAADPEQAMDEIAHFLNLDRDRFDPSVFDKRVRGFDHPPRLTREDKLCLEADWLWEAATEIGYSPRSTANGAGFARSVLRAIVGRKSH